MNSPNMLQFALQKIGRQKRNSIMQKTKELWQKNIPTFERVLKVLKAPVLKMTLFFWQKMTATMPITTINRKRGVNTAIIHRLLGGVFTTAITHSTKCIIFPIILEHLHLSF